MRRWLAAGGAAVVLATTACGTAPDNDATAVEVHRSPTCDCCGLYEEYLADEEFTVESVVGEDPDAVRERVGAPAELGSCHVAIVDGYFVEGHVPVDALRRLLDERPAIDGISLPGMPSGTPGMPGEQEEPWIVYAVADGEITEFARY